MAMVNLGPGEVKSICASLEVSPNGCKSASSPVYGTRKTAESSNNKKSNGGDCKESGFMGAPNSIKGPRR